MQTTGNHIADGMYDWEYMNPKETETVYTCPLCGEECTELFFGYSVFCKTESECCRECFETLKTW